MGQKINIGELAMGLALHPDMAGFKAGDSAISATVAKIKAMSVAAQTAKLDAQKLGESMGLLERRSFGERWGKGLVALNDKVHEFTGKIVKAGLALGALGAGVIAHELKNAIFETAKFGGDIDDMSQRTGIAADELQRLTHGAQINGVEMEGLQMGLVKLAKGLGDVHKEGSPAAAGLRALGISLNDPAVKSQNLEQILFLVANRFSAMPDGAEKAQASVDLFSKSGAQLIPFLNEGVLGIKKLGQQLDNMHGVIDNGSIKRLAALDDQFQNVKRNGLALMQGAVVKLVPDLEKLADTVMKWIDANRELIQQRIGDFFRTAVDVAQKLGAAIAFVAEHWQAFAVGFGAVTVVNGLTGILKTVVSINSALGALNPAWGSMGTSAALAIGKFLGPLGLVIGSLALLDHRLHAHDERDHIAGVADKDLTSGQAAQLRVSREAAPDVDSITIAADREDLSQDDRRKLDREQSRRSSPTATAAALKAVNEGSFGTQLNRFLVPQNIPLPATEPASGAVGPAAAASVISPSAPLSVLAPVLPAQGGSPTVNYSPSYDISIDATGMSPDQLQRLIGDQLRQHDEEGRRTLAANLGVGGV